MHSNGMRTDRTLTIFPYWWRRVSYFRDPPLKNIEKIVTPLWEIPFLSDQTLPTLTRHPL